MLKKFKTVGHEAEADSTEVNLEEEMESKLNMTRREKTTTYKGVKNGARRTRCKEVMTLGATLLIVGALAAGVARLLHELIAPALI